MTRRDQNVQLRLGFLTAVEDEEIGFVGALLVTSQRGRPLEFQCTTPVKPNRTQEILYGPTLIPFLLGDLIGRTLVDRIGVKPEIILVDRPEFFELRSHIDIPVCHVTELETAPTDQQSDAPADSPKDALADRPGDASIEAPTVVEPPACESLGWPSPDGHLSQQSREATESPSPEFPCPATPAAPTSACDSVQLGRQKLRFDSAHAGDRGIIQRHAGVVPGEVDLFEPFDRLRKALQETMAPGAKR